MKQELVIRNVSDLVEVPAQDEDDDGEDLAILTPEQNADMEAAAVATPYYTLLYLEVRSGLRRSEILALRWMDVDFDAGTLSVRRKLYYTKEDGLSFGPPKTKKSRRTFDISAEAVQALKDHQKAGGNKFTGPEDLIFHQGDGSPLFIDTISSWFPQFLTENGLPRLNFHALRHTHASLMLAAGADIKLVSERLGHSSTRITYDLYSHLLPTAQKDAADRLESLLKGNWGTKPAPKTKKTPGKKPRKP